MSKSRNVNKKREKQEAKQLLQKERRQTVMYACLVGILLIATIAVLTIRPDYLYLTAVTETGTDGEAIDAYIDADHGITYLVAPIYAYEPVEYIANPYAKGGGDYFYPMNGVSPQDYLAREVAEDIFDVYYNQELTLPTFASFAASDVVVCVDNGGRPSGLPLTFAKDEFAEILGEMLNGRAEEALTDEVVAVYTLRFVSEDYPFLFYCVKYVVTDNGSYYYDYVREVFITASDVVDDHLREYYQSTSGETTS